MINIRISEEIKRYSPNTRLGIIHSDIYYQKENPLLWDKIDQFITRIENTLNKKEITSLPVIQDTRQAYLAIGKEPARYRCSAEALLRRIVKKKGLYKVNNVVDIINFISLSYQFSIGCYDYNQIEGSIVFDIGRKNENYQAIGRGKMNIENLPVFRDNISAFGSPTSDSERTMITAETTEIVAIIIDFNSSDFLQETMEKTAQYLKLYAGAEQPDYFIV
ncbi:MAG: phenylalanine--tRNA ligase beta subunit-related protein [Atribacterota bacterium]|nr:phenylalanine--tRNA ligase beta subunit-related protein [Atribacterota bacterium]